ncbi:MAG: hypothetical protein RPU40_13440, partial [Candidatus Sedimenticola sp. (ex Thyasira tokunagai)]
SQFLSGTRSSTAHMPWPSRSLTLRHSIALLAAGSGVSSRYSWTPWLDTYFVSPLAQGTAGIQCGLKATRV